MLEQFWAKIWYMKLDGIAISYEVSQPAQINFIEITDDCITIYGGENFLVPLSDHKEVRIDNSILPLLFDFYKKNKEPSVKEFIHFVRTEAVDTTIKCSGNNFKYSNKIYPLNFRHDFWHVNKKIKFLDHHHYTDTNNNNVNKEGIKCLLDKIDSCRTILNMNVTNQEDTSRIIKEYEKQHLAMKQNAKKLGKESAKSFLFLVLTHFILDFSGRYLMPIMLYHSPDEISQHKNLLLNIGRIVQPLFILINQLLNYDVLLSRLVISVSDMIAQYAGIKWLPNEFFRFMNIAKLLLTSEVNEDMAKEVGFDVTALLGTTSAKTLGSLLSNCLIKQLPKLKNDPPIDPNISEGVVLNKNEQDQKKADHSNLRQRK